MRVNAVNAQGVPTSARRQRKWPTRRMYAALAAGCAAFAAYGSLVPLQFHRVPLDEAVQLFLETRDVDLFGGSRTDLASNVLLFIPLGFFFMGTLRGDRRGILGWLGSAMAILLVGVALSVAIEFAQLFVSVRTPSARDVIAQTIGNIVGIAAWPILGPALTETLWFISSERQQRAIIARLLSLYGVAFLMAQLLPLDLTMSLGELAQKYREGRIAIVPFQYVYPSTFDMLWDVGGDVVLYAPLGALSVLGWTPPGRRRSPLAALAIGTATVALIEFAQIFVRSRYADITDILVGSAGIVFGIAIATSVSSRPAHRLEPGASGISVWPFVGLACWTAALCGYHWSPFDFVFEAQVVKQRLPELFAVPFRGYYFGSEFHAFTELSRKLLLSAPVGVLLQLAWPLSDRPPIARLQTALSMAVATVVFGAVEAGQVFLPDRFPESTDVLVGVAGALIGIKLTRLVIQSRTASALTESVGSVSLGKESVE